MYYKVSITMTGRSYKADDEYRTFDQQSKCFQTLEEAQSYVAEKYGNCKRVKIYRDQTNGEALHIGWIYCFNNNDISHVPVDKWRQQDLVEITQVVETPIV